MLELNIRLVQAEVSRITENLLDTNIDYGNERIHVLMELRTAKELLKDIRTAKELLNILNK